MAGMFESERITQKTYNLTAKDWARDHNNTDYWREEFKTFSLLLPKGKVLDVGCGYGRDYAMFRDAGYAYVGLDFSCAFLAEMRKRFPEAKIVNANIRSIPALFAEDSFDGFWAAASLLHIEKSSIKDVIRGIRQVVKPAGIGFISVKKGDGEGIVSETRNGWAAEDKRFFAYYQLQEFSQILTEAGFTPILSGESRRNIGDTKWLEFIVRCDKLKVA